MSGLLLENLWLKRVSLSLKNQRAEADYTLAGVLLQTENDSLCTDILPDFCAC